MDSGDDVADDVVDEVMVLAQFRESSDDVNCKLSTLPAKYTEYASTLHTRCNTEKS